MSCRFGRVEKGAKVLILRRDYLRTVVELKSALGTTGCHATTNPAPLVEQGGRKTRLR
jgi:hypothetical protein